MKILTFVFYKMLYNEPKGFLELDNSAEILSVDNGFWEEVKGL